jgi:hypothetical protein
MKFFWQIIREISTEKSPAGVYLYFFYAFEDIFHLNLHYSCIFPLHIFSFHLLIFIFFKSRSRQGTLGGGDNEVKAEVEEVPPKWHRTIQYLPRGGVFSNKHCTVWPIGTYLVSEWARISYSSSRRAVEAGWSWTWPDPPSDPASPPVAIGSRSPSANPPAPGGWRVF